MVVVQATEQRQRDHLAQGGLLRGHRGPLAKPLGEACGGVAAANVLDDDTLGVPVVEHQDVVGHSRRSGPRFSRRKRSCAVEKLVFDAIVRRIDQVGPGRAYPNERSDSAVTPTMDWAMVGRHESDP
jgi:hypothetical protein